MCGSCNIKALPVAKAISYAYQIPLAEFGAANSRCKFKVWYCTSPTKVNAVLATIRLNPGEAPLKANSMQDMEELADHHDSGKDVADYGVNFDQLLTDNLHFTDEETKKTECNLACTY